MTSKIATSMTTTRLAFESALDSFKSKANLNTREEADIQFTTLDELRKTIKSIQDKQEQTKRLIYMKRLDPFLRAMEEYGKVIDVFVNTQDMIAFVWGPMKLILQIASSFSDALNSLLDTYQQLGESIPLLSQYQHLFSEQPHMQSILIMMYEDVLEFHREAMGYFRKKMWRQLFQAAWRNFNRRIERLRDDMRRHERLLQSQASIVQFEEIQNMRSAAERRYQEEREAQQMTHRIAVQQWLSAADSEMTQNECAEIRSEYPTTGRWLLNDSRFQKWFDPNFCSTPLLWLSGIPGAGKTILASLIIEEARKLPDKTVTFFYCKNEHLRNKFIDVTKGLLSQLLRQNDDLLPHLYQKMSTSGDSMLMNVSLAKQLLDVALKSGSTTYIVIDGLDECGREERKIIADWFRKTVESLGKTHMDRIRCLFLSQDDGFARKDLSMLPSIKLTETDTKGDIRAFAKVWHQKIERKFGPLDPKLQHVENIVTAGAKGMFLFAKLSARNLHDQTTRNNLEEELKPETFPKGLNEVYDRILRRIFDTTNNAHHKDSKRLLGWLSCAKRPLKWHEIQAAVSIDLEKEDVNFSGKSLVGLTSKDLCASLVEIRMDESVELVHPTAREYLIESKYVEPLTVEYDLAMLIFGYLCFPDITPNRTNDEVQDMLLRGYYAFLEYSISSWALHLQSSTPIPGMQCQLEDLAELLGVFLDLHYMEPAEKLTVSATSEKYLENFKNLTTQSHDFYKKLAQAFHGTKHQLGPHGKGLSEKDAMDLSRIIIQVRDVMEDLGSSDHSQDIRATLEKYYGTNLFKCPRMNCQYFYKGFASQQLRKNHVSRHERAFLCMYDGCPTAVFGCVTKKDLDRHMLDDHGVDMTGDNEFPEPPKKPKKETGEFECEFCPKRFTRKYNMKAHMRTHTGERPFKCSVCDKTFVRRHDCNRHEDGHSGEKQYECGGFLKDGTAWGCGLKFARSDKLGQHHNSEVGRRCKAPLRQQEAREKAEFEETQKARQEAQAQQQSNPRTPGTSTPLQSFGMPLSGQWLEESALLPPFEHSPVQEQKTSNLSYLLN